MVQKKIFARTVSFFSLLCFFPQAVFSSMKNFGTFFFLNRSDSSYSPFTYASLKSIDLPQKYLNQNLNLKLVILSFTIHQY